MTVYADVLLVINLFVNYALLLCSSMIMKNTASRWRVLTGAALGAFYGLVIFLPEIPAVCEFIMRLVASGLIVFAAFGFNNLRYFLRCFFTFLAVSFAFGGIMLVLWVTVAPVGMVYNNGAVYFDIDLAVLAVSTVVSFALVSLISHFAARRAPRESVALVKVFSGCKEISVTGLIDTGNSLCETFSGFPVVLGEYGALEKIIPTAVRDFIDGKTIEASPDFRVVPHRTVSGTGLLPVFRPDYIEVKTVSRTVRTDKVYIAVTRNNLAGGEYTMLLNPEIINGEKSYAEAVK
ncbi:MAG: sigma-E processing peptidase SpoIIGA [Clostridia bacterium]|nr:sigma-E processing peptidase SpoIIGA [Clostridia bacterium]